MSRSFRQTWAALASVDGREPDPALVKRVSRRTLEVLEALQIVIDDHDVPGDEATVALVIALVRAAATYAEESTDLVAEEFEALAAEEFEQALDDRETGGSSR